MAVSQLVLIFMIILPYSSYMYHTLSFLKDRVRKIIKRLTQSWATSLTKETVPCNYKLELSD